MLNMLHLQEYTCPVCGRPFAQGDDVVVCPDCGAPHHRECWKKQGCCAYAASHGTAEQWRPPLERGDDDVWACGNCGTLNPAGSEVCRKCGRAADEPPSPRPEDQNPPVDPAVFAPPYTPYGEVPPDGVVDGETAMDLATFLGPNAGYYLPRFRYFEQTHNPVSWNWAAALFPLEWLLYRKMGRAFWLALPLCLLLAAPYAAVFALWLGAPAAGAPAADPGALSIAGGESLAGGAPVWLLFLTHVASLLSVILRGALGMRANDLYRRRVKQQMARIRGQCGGTPAYRHTLSKKGGVSAGRVAVYLAAAAAVAAIVLLLIL